MTDAPDKLDPRRLILDALDDPESGIEDLIFVLRLTNPPTVEYVSKGLARLAKIPPETLYEGFDKIWESIHPDDQPAVREALADPAGRSSVTYRFRTAVDTWHWIEHRVTMRHDLGREPVVVGVGRDVTDQIRARDEAEQERRFIDSVLNTVGALVVILDDVGMIVRMNAEAEAVTGYSQSGAEGRTAWDLWLPQEEKRRVEEEHRRLVRGKGSDTFTNDIVSKDGKTRRIRWRNTTLKAASGRVEFVVATGVDVTEQERLSAERAELIDNLRECVKEVTGLYRILSLVHESGSPDDILRHAPDHLRHAFISPAETFVHIEIDGAIGETPGFDRSEWSIRETILSGGVERGHIEVSFQPDTTSHPGDPFIPEERELLERVAQVMSEALLRRDTEGALMTRGAALAATGDAIAITSLITEEFIYTNRAHAAMTGYPTEDLIGKSWRVFMPDGMNEHDYPGLMEALGAGQQWIGEIVVVRADGSTFPAEVSLSTIPNAAGEPAQLLSVMRDISERKAAEAELLSRATALDATADMVLIASREGIIEYVNSAFELHTGYSRNEALGQPTSLLKSSRQDVDFYAQLWETVMRGEVWAGEMINRRKDGSEYVEEMTVTPVKAPSGEVIRFVAIKRDISERKAAEAAELELARMAMTDPLTGLANRRQFWILTEQAIREAVRRKTEGAVAYLDLDKFKAVNDRFGHAAGDEILKQVAETIRSGLRRSDIVARMGGDEFAVLLHDTTPELARRKVGELLETVTAQPFTLDGEAVQLHCSAGVAGFPAQSASIERLMELADVALYQAKQRGGGIALLTSPGGATEGPR